MKRTIEEYEQAFKRIRIICNDSLNVSWGASDKIHEQLFILQELIDNLKEGPNETHD
jgi:hypothetical protein